MAMCSAWTNPLQPATRVKNNAAGGAVFMMASDFVLDVNEVDFEFEVVSFSQNTPVVVDFWADWCRPCIPLTALLERLVRGANGRPRLARVNSDQNPNLAIRFGGGLFLTVKGFSGGQAGAEVFGGWPEGRVREF